MLAMDMDNSDAQQPLCSSSTEKSSSLPRSGSGRSNIDWRDDQQPVIQQVDVPADDSCLFWAVTLAYLIPVKDNDVLFTQRYEALFGSDEIVSLGLSTIRDSIHNYNCLGGSIPDSNILVKELVRKTFRNRVVNHMLVNRCRFEEFVEGDFDKYLEDMRSTVTRGGEPEIRAMSEMLNAWISVFSVAESEYGNNENTRMQLFNVDLSRTGRARNHYNFGLEENIINNYQKSLMTNMLSSLDKYYNDCNDNDLSNNTPKNMKNDELSLERLNVEDIAKIKWHGNDKIMFKVTSEKELDDQLLKQSQIEQVQKELNRALETNDKLKEDILDAARNIARTYAKLGNYLKLSNNPEEAVRIAEQAIHTYKEIYKFQNKNLGKEHEHTLKTVSAIAFTNNKLGGFNSQGNPEAALRHHREASKGYNDVYKIQCNNLGKEHEHTLNTLCEIAYTNNKLGGFKSQDNPEEALQHHKEALETYKIVYEFQHNNLGKEHEATLNTLSDIAYTNTKLGVFKSQSNPEEALRYHKEALKTYRKVYEFQHSNLGKEHEATLNTLSEIAFTYNKLGGIKSQNNQEEALKHHEDASQLFKEIFEIQARTLGKVHERTLNAVRDIAYTNNNIGGLKSQINPAEALKYYEEALEMYRHVFEIRTRTFGKEYKHTINALRGIANTNNYLGGIKSESNPAEASQHHEEACQMFKEVFEIQTRAMGKEHKHTISTRRDIAYTNFKLGGLKSQDNPAEALKHYEDALPIFKEIFDIQTRRLGQEHEHTLNTLSEIANTNNKLGRIKSQNDLEGALKHHEKALQMLKEIFEIQTRTLGQEHEHTLKTLSAIGYTNNKLGGRKSLGNPEEALRHHKEALKIYNQINVFQCNNLGKEHETTLHTLGEIAYTNNKLGKIKSHNDREEALKHHENASQGLKEIFEIQKRKLGKEHEHTLNSLMDIAYTYDNIGGLKSQNCPAEALKYYEEASEMYRHVFEIRTRTLGKEYKLTIDAIRGIANTNNNLGGLKLQYNPAQALQYHDKASQMFKEILEIQTRTIGKEHKHTLSTRRDIAFTNFRLDGIKSQNNPEEALKRYEEALQMFKEIFDIQTRRLGQEHEHTLTSLCDIAFAYNKLGDFKAVDTPAEALEYYEESLKIWGHVREIHTRTLGKEHELTFNCLRDIAYTYYSIGGLKLKDNPAEALNHYEEVSQLYIELLEIQTRILGKENEHTLNSLRNFAFTNDKLGELKSQHNPAKAAEHYEEASQMFKELLGIQRKSLREDHDHTLKTLRATAFTNSKLGRLKSYNIPKEAVKHYEEASQMFKELLDIQRKTLNKEHDDTLRTPRDIAYINGNLGRLKSQNNPPEAIKHHEEASQMFKEVLAIQRKTLGEEHGHTLRTLRSIAFTNDKLGDLKSQDKPEDAVKHYEEEFEMLKEALEIQTRTLGKTHRDTIGVLRNIAFASDKLGGLRSQDDPVEALKRYEEAAQKFEEHLEIQTTKLGSEHNDTKIASRYHSRSLGRVRFLKAKIYRSRLVL